MGLHESDQVIEVFDVLIESSHRLSIIDPETGCDVLLGEDYKAKMSQRFHRVTADTKNEPTEVRMTMKEYVPACKYDLNDPEFK